MATNDVEWEPAANVESYNPNRFEFVWNDDYSTFKAIPLLWWDDVSYLRYQSDLGEEG